MPVSHSETDLRFLAAVRQLATGALAEALGQFKSAYAEAEAEGNADLMAACLCQIAWACYKLGDAQSGLECVVGARWLWRRLGNDREQVRALAVQAVLFLDLGLSDQAYELAEQAYALAVDVDDQAMKAFAANMRGIVLSVCREPALGLVPLRDAVAVADALEAPYAQGYYRLNVGFALAKQADLALVQEDKALAQRSRGEAIVVTRQACTIAEGCGDLWTQRVALCNLAEFYAQDGEEALARQCLEQWRDLPGDPGTSLAIHQLYTLGIVEHAAGSLAGARQACVQALEFATANGLVDHQVNAAERLCQILEEMGDVSAALAMHRRFHALYVLQSGELTRRRARVAEISAETERLRTHVAALANQALSDPLTGIANRRSFDQILNRLAGSPLAVAMLDLDNFKQINDRFSHILGDAVLQRVAQVLIAQLGSHGHAARLGGEEFALVFPNVPAAVATALCEGIRVAIANADWSDLAPDLTVTVSVGLAAGDGALPASQLMAEADERLYCAKAAGRNRVVGADIALLSLPNARLAGEKKSSLL